jgi:DNA-binding MarR family transcriptional regulator
MARNERASERTSARPIGTADYRRLATFRHALRRFLAFSEAAARQAGITPQQHQALLAIKGAPSTAGVTVGYLAGQLLLQPNSAAELVDRMVNCGLLAREEAPDDRRRVVLSLTPSAERALQALSAAHIREIQESAPVLDSLLALLKPSRAKQRRRQRTADS